jgi:hypothetical protein
VPLVLLLFNGLSDVVRIDMSPIAAGVLALTLNTSTFNCRVWRAALAEVPKEKGIVGRYAQRLAAAPHLLPSMRVRLQSPGARRS